MRLQTMDPNPPPPHQQQPTGKGKQPLAAQHSSHMSLQATEPTAQHQNGGSSDANNSSTVSQQTNGAAKYRSKSTTTASTCSSLPTPTSTTSAHTWPPQPFRVVNTLPLRILVLKDLVGAIIGRGGGTIKQITQDTHARVDVQRRASSTANEIVIMISGSPESCSQACRRILEVMQQEAKSLNRSDEVVLKILASNNLIGRIIGKGGNTIKRIMQQTDTKIAVSSDNFSSLYNMERIISISGQLENMCKAEVAISQKLRQCFENDCIQYQQLCLYGGGLHSQLPPPVMGQPPPGPLNMPYPGPSSGGGHHPHSHPHPSSQPPLPPAASLSYSLGAPSSSIGGRSGAHPINTATSAAGPGSAASSHNSHHHVQPGPPASSFYSSYQMPLMYSQSHVQPGTNIPGQFGPSGAYLNYASSYMYSSISNTSLPDNTKETVCVFIPNSVVGAIIGRGGSNIREMKNASGASIKVAPPNEDESSSASTPVVSSSSGDSGSGNTKQLERKVTIVGHPQAQYQAQYLVFLKVASELYNQMTATSSASASPLGFYGDPSILKVEILVPTNQVRRIIGKSGSVIQELQRTTGATIKLYKTTDTCQSPSSTSSGLSSSNGKCNETEASKSKSESSSTTAGSTSAASGSGQQDGPEFTPFHIIGDFNASFAAQRQIRAIVLRSSGSGSGTLGTSTTATTTSSSVPSSSSSQHPPSSAKPSARTTVAVGTRAPTTSPPSTPSTAANESQSSTSTISATASISSSLTTSSNTALSTNSSQAKAS